MKSRRHEAILELISKNAVSTQEELLVMLRNEGFDVTQATVSRDIKQLRLIKTAGNDGVHKYTVLSGSAKAEPEYSSIFKSSVISVVYAMNDVVVKCYSGMANAACAAIDSMNFDEIVGSLAGDDTVFIIAKSVEDAERLCSKLKNI